MDDEVKGLRLLTTKELAAATGIPKWRIHEIVSRGEGPPSLRIGRTYRFPIAGVQEWIRQQSTPQAAK
jgi:excisionase family DNA binding protein